jgi:transcriptional regulator with XRE-family HTH domain
MYNKNNKNNDTGTGAMTDTPKKTKGKPNPIDIHVGNRLRVKRTLLGLSQEKLAEAIGITFQQVQKYERGTNRISASRLYQFAEVLNVPAAYFFESYSLPATAGGSLAGGFSDNEQADFVDDDHLTKKETLELIKIYYSIQDPKIRKDLINIMKSMAENLKYSPCERPIF